MASDIQNLSGFVWQIARMPRGDFKQSEYGKVILPFVVMCRLDCILADTQDDVLNQVEQLPNGVDEDTRNRNLYRATRGRFYNLSKSTFGTLRHRIRRAKGCQSHESALHMILKLGSVAQSRRRRLRGFTRLAEVVAGVPFKDGLRTDQKEEEPRVAA